MILEPPAPRTRWLYALAALAVLLLLVRVDGYGIFRDELYYLACGEHLAWGYVDHPPLSPALAALVRATLGTSLLALRLVPALCLGASVYATGALAAELGGRRSAQLIAGLGLALAPVAVSLCSYFSMNSADLLIWSTSFLLYARLLRAPSTRGWIGLGLVLGVGLENKLSVLFLGFGLAVGLLVFARDQLRTRGPYLGFAVAVLLFLPHLVWQLRNGAPTLEFMANARAHKMIALSLGDWATSLWDNQGRAALLVWAPGLWGLWRSRFRALAMAFLAVLAALVLGDGKAYYAAPAFVPLLASGGVFWERRPMWARALVVVALLVLGAVALPFARPILPVETFLAYQKALGQTPSNSGEKHEVAELPQFYADMFGWRELATHVGEVFAALPAEERAVACVFAEDYGQAGAIDFFGPAYGLPAALSGHNAYWMWGPRGCTGAVMIVIGGEREALERLFTRVERASTHRCRYCMPYENDKPLWVARGLKVDLAHVWPQVKHYD